MINMFDFSDIKVKESPLSELAKQRNTETSNLAELDKPIAKEIGVSKRLPIEGNGGNWEQERGESKWMPERESSPIPCPQGNNPDRLSWGQILDKYKIDGVIFKNGEPDFSEVTQGTVQIEHFTTDRWANFDQADAKLAESRGCEKEQIAQWRKDNNYTWHEACDCTTMDLVPKEVHHNICHTGGVSVVKWREAN